MVTVECETLYSQENVNEIEIRAYSHSNGFAHSPLYES